MAVAKANTIIVVNTVVLVGVGVGHWEIFEILVPASDINLVGWDGMAASSSKNWGLGWAKNDGCMAIGS